MSPGGLTPLWSNPFAPEYDLTNQFQYVVKLTKVAGKHTLKFGGEYNRWQFYENHAPRFPMGLYNFGGFSADPNNPAGTGSGIADFILGFPSSGQTILGDDSGLFYRNNVRWWVNDQFRVGQNLTLDLGLRWEYDGPECEKYNRLDNFDPATGTVIIAGSPYSGESGSKAFFGFPVRGANCSTINRDLNAYAPRLGFAYSLPGHSDTVIRGGYGIFYYGIMDRTSLGTPASGFNTNASFSSADTGVTPAFNWNSGFPQNFPHPPIALAAEISHSIRHPRRLGSRRGRRPGLAGRSQGGRQPRVGGRCCIAPRG